MDKKNTMLLTVIAVATLLVAVVGATFAFFAISTNTNNANTTITGSTEGVVTAPIALTGTSTLKLELSAEDMSEANQGYYYFAGDNTTVKSTQKDDLGKVEDHKVTIGTVTLGQSGSAGVTYKCTANYTIKIDKISDQAITFVSTDDAVLTLYDDDGVVVNTADGFANAKTGISLSDLTTAGAAGLSGTVDFTLTSEAESDATKTLQASLRIKNSKEEQQDNLAGKSFNITFEATSFECDTVAS